MAQPQPSAAATPAAGKPARLKRHSPPWGIWLVCICCAAAIGVVRYGVELPLFDEAVRNIITLILGFIGSMTLLIWFVWRSAYSLRARLTTLALLLLAVIAVVATRRIDEVTGGLVPITHWRWEPRPDERLAQPVIAAAPPGDSAPAAADEESQPSYSQFLGNQQNNRVEGVTLDRDWQAHPPRQIWQEPIGAGWSAFAVQGDHAVTLEQRGTEELVSSRSVKTGAVQWATGIQARHATTLGGTGPRSTPTLYRGKVYALGATGVLRCLDLESGQRIWQHDLLKEFGVPSADADGQGVAWGRAGSPLVVDDKVVVPAGGPAGGPYVSLVAFGLDSGEEIWRGGDRQVSYASPSLRTLGGMRQIVIVNESSITGHDPDSGSVLWEQDWWGSSTGPASTSQTVQIDDRRLFVSKGYTYGAMLFAVERTDSGWKTEEIWHNRRVMQTKFTNVVLREGYVFGLSDGVLECIDVEKGERQWKKGRFGPGQILLVGDLILVLGEGGELALVEANPQNFVEVARIQALEGKTWNNMALVGPLLLIRNAEEAKCFRLPLVQTEAK